MATLTRKHMRCVGSQSGNQPGVRVYELDAAADLFAGDICLLDAQGELARAATPVAAADGAVGLLIHDAKAGVAGDWYLGSAAVNAGRGGHFGGTFVGASDLLGSIEGRGGHVFLASDDNIFEVSLLEALALSQVGVQIGLERDVAGDDQNTWFGSTAQATKSAVIIAIPNYPDQAIGDTQARVWIQFLPAASQVQ